MTGVDITWFDIEPKIARLAILAKRSETEFAEEWAEEVADVGEQELQAAVVQGYGSGFGSSTKKGGARIKSGEMISSIGSITAAGLGGATAVAGFGAANPTPMWTTFQEGGTRSIAAMLAVPAAAVKMGHYGGGEAGDRYLAKVRAEWETI